MSVDGSIAANRLAVIHETPVFSLRLHLLRAHHCKLTHIYSTASNKKDWQIMDCRMTQDQRDAFLADSRIGVLSLNQPGRGPLSVPVWYWYEPGGNLWFETEPDSRKGQLLEVGTRVSLCVQDDTPPYAYVSIEGPIIDIAEDDLHQHQIPMAIRYLGEQAGREFIDNLPSTDWRRYILCPERWLTYDGTKAS